jgi:hypothetical protein
LHRIDFPHKVNRLDELAQNFAVIIFRSTRCGGEAIPSHKEALKTRPNIAVRPRDWLD